MDLAPRRFADTVVLHPAGRINHVGSDELKAALEPFLASCAAGQEQIVLDLSALEYISSAGLRVLMLAKKQAKTQGGTLVVAGLVSVVSRPPTCCRARQMCGSSPRGNALRSLRLSRAGARGGRRSL